MPVFNLPRKPKLSFGVKKEKEYPKVIQEQSGTGEGTIKTPRLLEQTGKIKDPLRDAARSALMPGKRISKTGKVYWETRRNRSDMPGKRL